MRRLLWLTILFLLTWVPGCLVLSHSDIRGFAADVEAVRGDVAVVRNMAAELAEAQGDPNRNADLIEALQKVEVLAGGISQIAKGIADNAPDANQVNKFAEIMVTADAVTKGLARVAGDMEAVDPGKLEKAVAALDTASVVTDRLAALAADMEANSIDPAAAQEIVNTGSEIAKGINPTAGIIMAGIGTLGVRWLKRDQLKS